MIKIRLARGGRVHRPIYSIVATDSRSPRNGRFLEKLGQYDPNAKEALSGIKKDKLAHWLKQGAHLSDTVRSLLKKHKLQIDL